MLIQQTFIKYFLTDIVFSIVTAENKMDKLLVLMELIFWWEGQIKTNKKKSISGSDGCYDKN